MSHLSGATPAELAVHLEHVLDTLKEVRSVVGDVSARMATKADVEALGARQDRRAEALEARVTALEHGRTALIAGAAVLCLVCGGAGALVARLLPSAPQTLVAKAVP